MAAETETGGAVVGVLRVLAPEADRGLPARGRLVPERDLVFPLGREPTTLGRGLHNAIVLFDPTVSRDHAVLSLQQGVWTARNVSQSNPLLIDGASVPAGAEKPIAPGQVMQLGATQLQLVAPELPPSIAALAGDASSSQIASSASSLRPIRSLRFAWRHQMNSLSRAIAVVLALVFAVTAVAVVLGLKDLIVQHAIPQDGGTLPALMTLPLIPALGMLLIVRGIDRYGREPWYLLLSAFLWGAIIAIPPAFFIEVMVGRGINALAFTALPRAWQDLAHSALVGLNAGITEEVVKDAGLLVLLVLLRETFQNVTDGILFGAVIGAGFALTENIAYFATANPARNTLVLLILGRVILGWLGHSTFTACFGAALGLVREQRSPRPPWLVALLGFLAGVTLHTIFDFVDFQANTAVHDAPGSTAIGVLALLAVVANYIPLFFAQFVLYIMIVRSQAREAAVLRAYLVDDVRRGIVMPEEYLLLQRNAPWRQLTEQVLPLKGYRAWRAARDLMANEIGLAFALWRTTKRPETIRVTTPTPAAYRARIRRLRHLIAQIDSPGASAGSAASFAPRH
jgi:RsiW-degrading membrane proteinase PrsW (M82 family)